ncbi:hypothetical protein BX666DRAFT_1832280, partial [Dichotomocladium elegans]
FCPPLEESLARAILSDVNDYEAAHAILAELAAEARIATQEDIQQSDDNEATGSDDIDFLQACFPTLSLEKLSETLSTQNNDLEKTTDVLLNATYLANDFQDSDSVGEDNDKGGMDQRSRRNKQKKKKKTTTIFASGHLPYQRTDDEEDDECDQLATVPFNYWHQYDSHVAEITRFLPTVARSRALGAIQRCRGNLIAAVRDLMIQEPKPRRAMDMSQLRELEKLQEGLSAVLTDRSDDVIKQIAFGVMINYYWQQKQGVIEPAQQLPIDWMVSEGVEFALNFDKQQEELEERLKLQEAQRALMASKANEMPAVPEYLLVDNFGTYVDDDPEVCRSMAMQLIMERNLLFMKAAEAYRRKKNAGPGEAGIAFYYSDEASNFKLKARKLDSKARAWNMRAARALVRSHRINTKDDHLLDLHGLTIEEAKILVREGVTQWWSRSQIQLARRAIRPLKIITGVGKHSAYGEARLMPSVIKFLKNEGWRIEIPRPGCILVKGVQNK